jgi:hypothetical protein
MTLPDKFWKRVNKNGPIPVNRPDLGPCHIWTAGKDSNGYGQWWINGKTVRVYISTYEDMYGPIPKGLVTDHLCREHSCCNPAHLETVTNAENIRRGDLREIGKITGAMQRAKTHCPHGHPYDEKNTKIGKNPNGGTRRSCRACGRIKRVGKKEE